MSIRTLFIGGTHPRHLYYFNRIAPHVRPVGAVMQERGDMIPMAPYGLAQHDAQLWEQHFIGRATTEHLFFERAYKPKMPHDALVLKNIDTREAAAYVREREPDLVLIFGSGMIRGPLYDALPLDSINLHLGLSPRYRGAATLFWPFYFLEPNHAGTTFHRIVHEPDAGDILHQSRPPLKKGDGIHDTGARAVVDATNCMVELLLKRKRGQEWEFKQQRNTGKCFLAGDFQPQHLRLIYDVWDNKIGDAFLAGEIAGKEPIMYQDNLKELAYA